MASKVKAKKSGAGFVPLLIFIGVCSVVAPPTMIILAGGMVPSIVATLLNPARIKGSLAAMAALNLAGVIPVLGFLWERGHTIDQAVRLLLDPFMWLFMFGGAGFAAFLLWGVPIVVQAFYEVKARQAINRYGKRRAKLIEEWGGQIIDDSKIQSSVKAVRK